MRNAIKFSAALTAAMLIGGAGYAAATGWRHSVPEFIIDFRTADAAPETPTLLLIYGEEGSDPFIEGSGRADIRVTDCETRGALCISPSFRKEYLPGPKKPQSLQVRILNGNGNPITLGHQAGDGLLRQFGGRLLEVSPPGVTVARLGGDEFAALIEGESFALADAEVLCQAILNVVKAPFSLANGQAHVGVSIGVAWMHAGEASAEDLMRRADIALYTMKAAGRAGYRVFSDDLELEVRNRAEIEAALRETLACGEGLSLAYQPKVDRHGRITGVEALVRWRMDGRSISPALFVPIAEEVGLILELGEWVIQEAIEFAKRWPTLSVAINLSPAQLRDDDFATRLLRRVEKAELKPSQLELEVTETTLFESTSYALGALSALRAAGLRVALDDFGTGYSSLRHLHSVAVDRVKIDQSFVAGLGRSIESGAIISAVIQLGHSMGLPITAEGVETTVQRDFLVEAGCDELQGYLFARPMPENDLVMLFDRNGLSLAA